MHRTYKTTTTLPDGKIGYNRTYTEHRTWNPVWKIPYMKQENYLYRRYGEGGYRNTTTSKQLQQRGRLHAKSSTATLNQGTQKPSRKPRPSSPKSWLRSLAVMARIPSRPQSRGMQRYCTVAAVVSSTLKMKTQSVPGMLEEFCTLMRLVAREDFTEFCRSKASRHMTLISCFSKDVPPLRLLK